MGFSMSILRGDLMKTHRAKNGKWISAVYLPRALFVLFNNAQAGLFRAAFRQMIGLHARFSASSNQRLGSR